MPAPELKHIDLSLKMRITASVSSGHKITGHVSREKTRLKMTSKELVSHKLSMLTEFSDANALAAALMSCEACVCATLRPPNTKRFESILVDGYYILNEPSRHPHPDRWYIIEGLRDPDNLLLIVYADSSSKIWCSFDIFKPRFFEIKINEPATYWPIRPGVIMPIHASHLTRFCKEA